MLVASRIWRLIFRPDPLMVASRAALWLLVLGSIPNTCCSRASNAIGSLLQGQPLHQQQRLSGHLRMKGGGVGQLGLSLDESASVVGAIR